MTAVGIDLGTTFSAVAAVDSAGRPRILPNRDGAVTTPSVVYFDGDTPLVGRAARIAASRAPHDAVELVKRHLGEPAWRHETASGTAYTAEEISALILRSLADDATTALGRPVHDAVITVPAYFDDARRRATIDAGTIAGLKVLRVLNEPTAAALAFGYGARRNETVLVYDLGGGTFDVTVVRLAADGCEVLATDGDRNLGGFDVDNALMAHVTEAVLAAGGPDLLADDLLEAALRDRCEHAKRQLSSLPDTAVRVTAGGGEYSVPVTRPTFEALTRGLLRRTEEIVADVLDAAGGPQLSAALLVGGSTRMPMVAAMVERVAGVRADRSVHPDEAVALGAALQAADLSQPRARPRQVVRDVTAHSLGLLARSSETGGQFNSVVIPRNSAIPCAGRRRYRTLAENQQEILLEVTEGEDTDPRYVTVVGSGWVSIPPRADATVLDVVVSYDEDGVIAVDVVDAATDEPLGDFSLDRQSNLDEREVERLRAALHQVRARPA